MENRSIKQDYKSLIDDLKKTNWKLTIFYNLQRALAAGLLWIPLTLIVNKETTASFLLFPLIYLMIIFPVGLIIKLLGAILFRIPVVDFAVGLIWIFLSLCVAIGDPLVFVIDKLLPGLIPVEKPRFFDLSLLILVMKREPSEMPETPVEYQGERFDILDAEEVLNDNYSFKQISNSSEKNESSQSEQKNEYVKSVMIRSLINKAILLEAEGNSHSVEQAHLLWKEALKLGGLTFKDELLCHYHLGSYYFSNDNIVEGIKHQERVILQDPDLNFLSAVDQSQKQQIISDINKSISAAYQYNSRKKKDGGEGIKAAIIYLEEKLNILKDKAAPSLCIELGSYYGIVGEHDKAREMMRRAFHAPTYGSEFQEKAKESAAEFLESEARESATARDSDKVKDDKPIFLGREPEERKRTGLKWVAGGFMGVTGILIAYLFLLPSQYKRYYTKAFETYNHGNYSEALTLVNLAREKKATTELSNLENAIRKRIREREAQTELQKKQNEYNTYYQKAQQSFKTGKYDESLRFAQRAAENISTQEVNRLISQLRTKIREQTEKERIAADDNAFILAFHANNQNAYLEYLRLYPDGRHVAEAKERISRLRTQQVPGSATPGPPRFQGQRRETFSPLLSESISLAFSLKGTGRETVEFTVTAAGRLQARAEWTGSATRLALILNGPGQVGYYARQDGPSPLVLSFEITEALLAKGASWKISVSSFQQNTTAQGTIHITPPAPREPAEKTAVHPADRSNIVDVGGIWELVYEGTTARLSLSIVQRGNTIQVQVGRNAGSGLLNGYEISWTSRHSSSLQSGTELTFTGIVQGNRMTGTATSRRYSSQGTSTLSSRRWSAVRKTR